DGFTSSSLAAISFQTLAGTWYIYVSSRCCRRISFTRRASALSLSSTASFSSVRSISSRASEDVGLLIGLSVFLLEPFICMPRNLFAAHGRLAKHVLGRLGQPRLFSIVLKRASHLISAPGAGVAFPTVEDAEEIQRGRVDGAREHVVLGNQFGDGPAFRARPAHDPHRFQDRKSVVEGKGVGVG